MDFSKRDCFPKLKECNPDQMKARTKRFKRKPVIISAGSRNDDWVRSGKCEALGDGEVLQLGAVSTPRVGMFER